MSNYPQKQKFFHIRQNHQQNFVKSAIFVIACISGHIWKILQNLDVRIEAQANGKEVWINKRPKSDCQCSDWQRILSDDEALTGFLFDYQRTE